MGTPLGDYLQQPDLVTEICCSCAVQFAMPREMYERRRRDHQMFYCPAGHAQHYTSKSNEEELRDELEREKRRHEFTRNARDVQQRRAEAIERRRRAEKAEGLHEECEQRWREDADAAIVTWRLLKEAGEAIRFAEEKVRSHRIIRVEPAKTWVVGWDEWRDSPAVRRALGRAEGEDG